MAAANQSVHRLLGEAWNWMEVSAETPDGEVWERTLMQLNLSLEELTDLEISPLGKPLLRSAFPALRARRAAEWRVQQTFEELIATVRRTWCNECRGCNVCHAGNTCQ